MSPHLGREKAPALRCARSILERRQSTQARTPRRATERELTAEAARVPGAVHVYFILYSCDLWLASKIVGFFTVRLRGRGGCRGVDFGGPLYGRTVHRRPPTSLKEL